MKASTDPRARRRIARLAVLIASSTMAGLGCVRSGDDAERSLVITGSSTLAPLVAEIARRYEDARSGLRIDVQSGGSSRGIADVRSGLADVGMVSRALMEAERSLVSYPVARDGVGIVVHAGNPVAVLGRDELLGIYRGEIARWSEVGGRDAPVSVVHKAEGRATREVFLAYLELDASEVEADVIVGENEQAIKTVTGSPDAIAYVSIGTAAVDIEHGVPIRLVPVAGVAPTLENVRGGRYPIARPLNLVTREPARGLARAFIDHVRSEAARPVFEAQSFVQTGREHDATPETLARHGDPERAPRPSERRPSEMGEGTGGETGEGVGR